MSIPDQTSKALDDLNKEINTMCEENAKAGSSRKKSKFNFDTAWKISQKVNELPKTYENKITNEEKSKQYPFLKSHLMCN